MTHDLTDQELQNELDTFTAAEPLLQLFRFAHLPEQLRPRSRPFAELALNIVWNTPGNPERSTALRRLREAKDCNVTAHLWGT